jgi:hypothetical protein
MLEQEFGTSIWFRVSLIVTAILVTISVIGRIWLEWLWEARDEGAFIVYFLWIIMTVLATLLCSLMTLGMWIARKIRNSPDDESLHL